MATRQRAPACPGQSVDAIDTPALVLDLDRFERNLSRLHERANTLGVRVRSHAKAHKCVEIARRQIAAGAVGLCVQKLAEAEVFVAAGFKDVLLTNQIASIAKAQRLAALTEHARIGVCVDAPEHIELLARAMAGRPTTLEVLIEIDVGMGRCGVHTVEAALELARMIADRDGLSLRGLQAYHGKAQHLRLPAQRRDAIGKAADIAASMQRELEAQGHSSLEITGAGTGTWLLEARSGVYTEIQPGSYVLMDADYGANEGAPDEPAFEQALAVRCALISRHGRTLVLDGGLKSFAVDSGLPVPEITGWRCVGVSDEHALVEVPADTVLPPLGSLVSMVPGHCDPTVNLHEWIVAYRGETVEAVWPVDARGAVF
ncbi:MAG: DSD1 family PLP-dependent enzyme [Burkholderiaceae bacterium]|nr:DSD1 family PLP-dependent enzyme [Burkholderiaceae bacterium]